MTKLMTDAGWVYLVIVLDWYSKKIVGFHLGYQSRAKDWAAALDMAVNQQFPQGVRGRGLSLMSDNGCQPTATSFLERCGLLEINQAFTVYNNPKGNADTERMMRTIKEELLWLNEWTGLDQVKQEFDAWRKHYNHEYFHSALKWKTPQMAEDLFYDSYQYTPLVAA